MKCLLDGLQLFAREPAKAPSIVRKHVSRLGISVHPLDDGSGEPCGRKPFRIDRDTRVDELHGVHLEESGERIACDFGIARVEEREVVRSTNEVGSVTQKRDQVFVQPAVVTHDGDRSRANFVVLIRQETKSECCVLFVVPIELVIVSANLRDEGVDFPLRLVENACMRKSAFGIVVLCAFTSVSSVSGVELEKQLRRPVGVEIFGGRVLVANRASGTVSLVDPAGGVVVAEYRVAERIADLVKGERPDRCVVLDDAKGALLELSVAGDRVSVDGTREAPKGATKICVARDGERVFLTSRWPRRVESITGDKRQSLALPFAPRDLLLVDEDRVLLVADAFRGHLAVIEVEGMKLRAICRVEGHNIRSLALSADGARVLIAHQRQLKTLADYEELHWGRMVSHAVHEIELARILAAKDGEVVRGWFDKQGGIGRAAGDPSGVVAGEREGDVMAVAFSGVAEVVVRRNSVAHRLSVGEGPEAMAILGNRLFVANRFDDSLSVVDVRGATVIGTISLGPSRALTAVERGEKLFFDARLSHDGWISCHSCHTDGHSSDLLVDTLGDGDYGAPKRVPSLLGTRKTAPWGWTGSAASLAEQVEKSVMNTMHRDEPLAKESVADLVAFLETLEPPPAPSEFAVGEVEKRIKHGESVFRDRGCVDCHTPSKFTTNATFDVGLADEKKRTEFNPPFLRGVSQRTRFFHDGRARSLEDVLTKFQHQLEKPLDKSNRVALLAYLKSL